MSDETVSSMRVGQIWRSCDDRDGCPEKEVVEIKHGKACMQHCRTGRKIWVYISKFLSRQGQRSGYRIVRK